MKICFLTILLLIWIGTPLHGQSPDSGVELKILSWNIQMLPTMFAPFSKALRKKQHIREPEIVKYLKDKDFDLIVFQEVFHKKMYRRLRKAMKSSFPYQVQTFRKPGLIRYSNGVWIISKVPIREIDHIFYSRNVGVDKHASKGCTMIEGQKAGKTFQILGTHLQAGGPKEVKASQLQELMTLLMIPNQKPLVPQFLVGDLNIEKGTEAYNQLLIQWSLRDTLVDDLRPFTCDSINCWKPYHRPIRIDYCLMKPQGSETEVVHQTIIRPKMIYRKKPLDLSDHFGLSVEIRLK